MLDYFAEYKDELCDIATHYLSRSLEAPLNTDEAAITILAQRYVNCLSLDALPSESILFLYRFGIDLDRMDEGYSLAELINNQATLCRPVSNDEVARSCEVYGGVFPKRMDSRHSGLNRRVVTDVLAGAYYGMVRVVDECQKEQYAAFSSQPENILFAFQRSSTRFPWA